MIYRFLNESIKRFKAIYAQQLRVKVDVAATATVNIANTPSELVISKSFLLRICLEM